MNQQEMNDKKIEILNHYGVKAQLIKLQEECGELITAISKYFNNETDENKNHVLEEIADVGVVSYQIVNAWDKADEVSEIQEQKIDRELKRIEVDKCQHR